MFSERHYNFLDIDIGAWTVKEPNSMRSLRVEVGVGQTRHQISRGESVVGKDRHWDSTYNN